MEILPKSLQAAADLDAARCRGQWTAVPELARRYKKYHPDESVLDATAKLEAEFVLLLQKLRSSDRLESFNNSNVLDGKPVQNHNNISNHASPLAAAPDTKSNRKSLWAGSNKSSITLTPPTTAAGISDDGSFYRYDDPQHISLPPPLNPAQTQNILLQLLKVIQSKTQSQEIETTDGWQAQFGKILAARIYYETGRYDKALESLQNLALRMEDVHTGYGMVLLVQARVIKGICFEQQGDIPAALEAYDAAWDVVEKHPAEKGETLSCWIEECLYRAILLRIRSSSPVPKTLRLLRGYMHMATSHWTSFWRMHKRWIIFRHYIIYLTKISSNNTYVPMPISSNLVQANGHTANGTKAKKSDKASAYEELLCLTALFRNLLSTIGPRLEAHELSEYVLELSNLMVDAHDAVGWGEISNIRRVLQFLQKAKEKCFNNPCIARHLFLCLLRLGHFDEAKYAFRNYMELVGTADVDKVPEMDVDVDVAGKVLDIQKRLQTRRRVATAAAADHQAPKQPLESEIDVLQVLLKGIQLYARECRLGKVAAILGDLAVEFVQNIDPNQATSAEEWMELMVQVHRMRGIAYGIYALQSENPETRAEHHHEAISSLKKAIELDDVSWQTYYELAVEQAETKDIAGATASIGRSLQLNPRHIQSWHLLALLASCNRRHQLAQGLQSIQAAISECDLDIPAGILNSLPVLSWNKEKDSTLYINRGEAYLNICIAQVQFLEALEGSEAVMNLYSDLFSMYAQLSKQIGISQGLDIHERMDFISSQTSADYTADSRRSSVSPQQYRNASVSSDIPSSNTLRTNTRAGRSKSVSNPRTSTMNLEPPPPLPGAEIDNRNSVNMSNSTSEEVRSNRKSSVSSGTSKKDKKPRKKSMTLIDLNIMKKFGTSSQAHLPPPPPLPLQVDDVDTPSSETATSTITTDTSSSSAPKRESIMPGSTAANGHLSAEANVPESPSIRSLPSSLTPSFSLESMRRSSSSSSLFFEGSQGSTPLRSKATPSSSRESTFIEYRRDRWQKLLIKLWLQATSSFIRAQRFQEACYAILEAEQLGPMDADVWYQLGELCIKASKFQEQQELWDMGLDAFKKALTLDPDHAKALVSLSSAFITMQEFEVAEGYLERVTKGRGWDNAEAWYLLGSIYKQQGNLQQAKESLLYASELYEATPLSPFYELPRFVL